MPDGPVEWPVEGITEEEALERWPDEKLSSYSDPREERIRRARLSIQAKQRHATVVDPASGRRAFGGPQPGSGRPRRKRLAEKVTELAQGSKQEKIIKALFSGLDHEDERVRVRTAVEIARMEHREAELQLKEDDFDRKPRDELLDFLLHVLPNLSKRGDLPDIDELAARLPHDAESTAEEEPEPEPEPAESA